DGTATALTRSAAAPAMNVRRAAHRIVLDVIEKPPGILEKKSASTKTPRHAMLAKNTARLRL
ncbi:hypothetical protein, partial [Mesorhizobium sp. M7A.F.Ca.MR.176.00.0.0]|uniref:hypothetical protein n=1 Tax=Mesorhizobium sp. M7A.F.Ca.MR.176.00.0.0 TaxID=2496776 RepID=UPI0019D48CB8